MDFWISARVCSDLDFDGRDHNLGFAKIEGFGFRLV
jgi:hypothetical protein